jgi:hypothetical protein
MMSACQHAERALPFRDFPDLIGVKDERLGDIRERATVKVLALAGAVAEFQIPVGRHAGRRAERSYSGAE